MLVNGGHNAIPPVGSDGGSESSGKTEARRRPRTPDVVEISAKARLLSTNKTDSGKPVRAAHDMKAEISKVRAEIGERLKSGFYESEEVLSDIANRILDLLGF
jgi:hypothetical protein